ncbi:MAG: VWA domain-containing protein [Peptococcaceae bacterium]|nr:VWA domain-containing protein [Peptococcaceae bacterium]
MKKGLTELVFILDRSGSMSGLEQDTIGGYNSLLCKQQTQPGEATVTTVLFDDRYELLHDRVNIKEIAPITEKDYYVRGCTALLDAIGRTIDRIGLALSLTNEEERPEKVMIVITTDGMENASQDYDYTRVRAMIKLQKETYNWDFVFIGANIDAIETAGKIGISEDRAANYHADTIGTKAMFEVVSHLACRARGDQPITEAWKEDLEEDYR